MIALGEALGCVIAAAADMGVNEIGQRELLDLGIKQCTNAILASRGEMEGMIITRDFQSGVKQ